MVSFIVVEISTVPVSVVLGMSVVSGAAKVVELIAPVAVDVDIAPDDAAEPPLPPLAVTHRIVSGKVSSSSTIATASSSRGQHDSTFSSTVNTVSPQLLVPAGHCALGAGSIGAVPSEAEKSMRRPKY